VIDIAISFAQSVWQQKSNTNTRRLRSLIIHVDLISKHLN